MISRSAAVAAAILAAACGQPLDGTQLSTDYYREVVSGEQYLGAVAVRVVTTGDATTVSFAPAERTWKDPRPAGRGPGNPPMVSAGCSLKATRTSDKLATIASGQTCTHEGRTLIIERGSVWVAADVINVDIAARVDGREYLFTYPMAMNGDPLPLTRP
jgi:hypothetical protein